MVILRDLDNDDERSPPRPLIIDSPLERQVREHFTRPDGSFDYSGYFSEVMGESFNVGELEGGIGGDSSDSNSDSSSGNSSDCVIISPSSFTGKLRDESLAIIDVGSEAMAMEVSSIYRDLEIVEAYRKKFDISGTFNEKDVVFEPVEEGEYVVEAPRSDLVTFFMYTKFIDDFHLFFPFTEFQQSMLRVLNVAPSQLSPNSWSFIKAFELVCCGLEVPEPSVAVFFSFYQVKSFLPHNVVPLSAQPNRGLFQLYSSNYRYYKDTFVRVRGAEHCPSVMYDDSGAPLFPFYWTDNPRLIKGAVYERLSEFERDTVAYLESMNQMHPWELLDAERAPAVLNKYLQDMSSLTPAQRREYLEKARRKKEQPDSKVDVLSQLDVGEDKRKRKHDSKISVLVKPSSSGSLAGEKVAKNEEETKSPVKKKLRGSSRRSKKDQDVAEVDKDLVDVDNYVAERSPAMDEAVAEAIQAAKSSPWDPMFDPEAFLSKMVDMAGNSAWFINTATGDLARMALGYELKGLLLNYALASRQRAELSAAKDKEALVEKNLVVLEKDVETAKARCEGELKSLKEKHAKDVADLEEKYKGDLSEAKKDKEAAVKAMNDAQASLNSKDERIKALTQENEVALTELKSLKEEKAGWISQKDALEIQAGEQYDEGFAFALEQVKILFPDLDPALLSQADAMALVEDGKLIPYVPSQPIPDSTAKESPAAMEDPPADE
ncbi:hypothetical protein P8452_50626 [Trifolium repens]|nr:hypothetical protein P8452_50626 [Trifolium repens]